MKKAIVAEYDAGADLSELTRKHQISPATFYKWKQSFEQQHTRQGRRLKELESENALLKKMFAELSLDHQILKEGYELTKK
jgi:putative transposase